MGEPIPTEAVLDATRDLSQRSLEQVLAAIHAEDARALTAVGEALPAVATASRRLAGCLAAGGRWLNVGAGTSGRMGALDAAELPPTFGSEPDRVQAVLAGGPDAFPHAVEGAEDDGDAARRALCARGLGADDAVLAISASGRTPFALAALDEAGARGAARLALTCDPDSPLAGAAEIAIATCVGPEVIAGSTRMKGGLAQKMVLSLLSTSVMVQLGRVEGNLMRGLTPTSAKLRARALRIVMALGGVDEARARELLERSAGRVDGALALARANGGDA